MIYDQTCRWKAPLGDQPQSVASLQCNYAPTRPIRRSCSIPSGQLYWHVFGRAVGSTSAGSACSGGSSAVTTCAEDRRAARRRRDQAMRFCLLDRILELEPGVRVAAVKRLRPDEDYLKDHFPRFPV